ncbi:MAG: single-stranded DNA-binding protein [Pseudomonadales bacterium]
MGHDPVLTEIPTSSTAVCNVSVASDESYTDRSSGERVKQTEWHRVTFFGRSAEAVAAYGHKGRAIFAAGPLRKSTYQDDTGHEKLGVELRARQWRFTGPLKQAVPASNAPAREPSSNDFDDDIPF